MTDTLSILDPGDLQLEFETLKEKSLSGAAAQIYTKVLLSFYYMLKDLEIRGSDEEFLARLGGGIKNYQPIVESLGASIENFSIAPDANVRDLIESIKASTPFWDWQDFPVKELHEALRQGFEKIIEKPKPRRKRSASPPLARNGAILVRSDRITRATTESFLPNALRRGDIVIEINESLDNRRMLAKPEDVFWAACAFDFASNKNGDLTGAIGYKGTPNQRLWELLQKNSALAIKVQFALMARANIETNFAPGRYITVNMNQLCDDLGYKRKKGAHARENKEKVKEIIDAITARELVFRFEGPPDRKGERKRYKYEGPYWGRGSTISVEEKKDENGKTLWSIETFSFAPGDFFAADAWREYNSTIAHVGEGLLKLSAKNEDKHALMLGSYIAMFARINRHKAKAFRVKTLIEKVFDTESAIKNDNTARLIDTLERALDQLKVVDVIGSWRYATDDDMLSDCINYDDLDSTITLDTMSDEAATRRNTSAELNKTIIIDWPVKIKELAAQKLMKSLT